MSFRISPLRLESFEQLPKHARRCVFWEVDPQTVSSAYLPDPEFEKEAWLSMVMLEWGSCGQMASTRRTGGYADGGADGGAGAGADGGAGARADAEADREDDEDARCLGYVLYAPPRLVPRVQRMPTGPVSADAVLLTSLGVEPGQSDGMPTMLIGQVVNELVRRGVRALEAFGRTAAASELADGDPDPEVVSAVAALGDCGFDQCMIDADFLLDAGFTVVAPHRYFPRLRLELDKGLGWKAEVEAALERLLHGARLEQVVKTGV